MYTPNIYCRFVIGNDVRFYNIDELCLQYGEETCKVQFWDCWLASIDKPILDDVFQRFSDTPSEVRDSDLEILKTFIIKVYDKRSITETSLTDYRLQQFSSMSNSNLRLLPLSLPGLVQHTKRACIQAWWIWCGGVSNVDIQDPNNWGWILVDDRHVPTWQVVDELKDVLNVIRTCTCTKKVCRNFVCAKHVMRCLPFCECKMNSENKSH